MKWKGAMVEMGADLPELAAVSRHKQYNSRHPCHACEVPLEKLGDFHGYTLAESPHRVKTHAMYLDHVQENTVCVSVASDATREMLVDGLAYNFAWPYGRRVRAPGLSRLKLNTGDLLLTSSAVPTIQDLELATTPCVIFFYRQSDGSYSNNLGRLWSVDGITDIGIRYVTLERLVSDFTSI